MKAKESCELHADEEHRVLHNASNSVTSTERRVQDSQDHQKFMKFYVLLKVSGAPAPEILIRMGNECQQQQERGRERDKV